MENNHIAMPEHMGTHIDAPIHTVKGAWKTNQISIEKLYGSGVIINVKTKAVIDPDYRFFLYHHLIVSCIHIWLKDRVNFNILFNYFRKSL